MRPTSRLICAGSIAAFLAAFSSTPTPSRGAMVYWDTNDSTAGSGGVTPTGSWNGSNWSTSALGTSGTTTWVSGNTAVFSAGSDATGAFTVSLTGTQTIGGLVFEEGTVTLSGGTLALGAASDFYVNSGLAARIDSALSGSLAINKTGFGSLRLGGDNSAYTGALTISAGTLTISSVNALGSGAQPVTVAGNNNRGQGGGQLIIGGSISTHSNPTGGLTITQPLIVNGGGPTAGGAAIISIGDNTITNLTSGATASNIPYAVGGTTTVTSYTAGVGQNTQFNGPGNWILSGVTLSGQTSTLLQKAGTGGMSITGTNYIDNEVRVSGGSLRVASGVQSPDNGKLPILSPDAGVLELRTDDAASFVDTRFIARGNATTFLDRAVGSTNGLLNQTVVFSDSQFASVGVTQVYTSRNGYGLTLSGAGSDFGNIPFANGGNVSITNTLTGMLTFAGNLSFTDGTTRTYTIQGNGDSVVTGNILGTGGVHILAKGTNGVVPQNGTGTLTLQGTASTYAGGTIVNVGTLAANRLTGVGNGVISLGSVNGGSSNSAAFDYLGAAGTGAGETSAKVFSLAGSTGGGAILANQSGGLVSPLVLTSNVGAAATGTGTKVLFLGGTSTVNNELQGVVQNAFGAGFTTAVTKVGSGTWLLSPTADNYVTTAVTSATSKNAAVTATSGQAVVSVGDVTGLAVGQIVQGTNVPAGASIISINAGAGTITLSANLAADITSGTTLNFSALAASTATTVDSAINTNVLTIGSTTGLRPGQTVAGANIPAGSVITAVTSGTTFTISNNISTAVASGTTLGFGQVTNFTGNVTVAGGTLMARPTATVGNGSDVINNSSALRFDVDTLTNNQSAGGTFEYIGLTDVAGLVETVGTLTAANGAGTVKVTPSGTGSATLRVSSITASTGTGLNIVVPASATLAVTTATAGVGNTHVYFNGADFSYTQSGSPNTLRAPNYGTDAGFPTSATTLTSAQHNQITGSFATNSISINSLKISGANTLTINAGQTLTVGSTAGSGILQTGGSGIITGGTALAVSAAANDLAVRVEGDANSLTINTPITVSTAGLTKNGAGTLILGGANTYTGTVFINEGTLKLSGSATLGGTNIGLTLRQGGTFDLNGVNVGTTTSGGIGTFNGAGTITNTAAGTTALIRVGNNSSNGLFSGIIQDGGATAKVQLVKGGGGTLALTGVNTFTGRMTLGGGTVQATLLADIGVPSSIGAGDGTSNATNADSLVFNGGTLQYTGNTTTSNNIYQTTQTPSVSINRLFTMQGAATIDSSGTFGANTPSARSANNASLIFNNTAPIVYSGAGTRSLTLTGDSTGDNEFRPRLTDNAGSALSVTKANTGLWILNPDSATPNTYTGVTTISGGMLQAVDGIGIPTTSNITLNGGVFQSSGTFSRSIGTAGTQVQGNTSTNGGFAAGTGKLTVNFGGAGATQTWGTGGIGNGTGTLLLSSTTAQAEVEVVNPIDFGGTVRTVQVDDNTLTAFDFAILSGVLSNGALTKTGLGMLYLTNPSNSYNGTILSAGTVVVNSIGNQLSATSNLGVGGGTLSLGGGTLMYVGNGETTNRAITLTATTNIDASGSGPLVINNFSNNHAGTVTLVLTGVSSDVNEMVSNLNNSSSGGALALTKGGAGIWLLSGNNGYTGATAISGGALGIATNSPFGSSPLVTVTNASLFAVGTARTITNNVLFAGNANEAVIGDHDLTINGAVTFGNNSNNTTLTNFITAGKLLTINGTVTNTDTTANRTLVINGTGTTNITGVVQNQATNSRLTNITYNGTGLLILSNAANTYTGPTTAAGGGAIQAIDGQGLPASSNLVLAGGVFQVPNGIFNRMLGTTPGRVQWSSSGGFAAVGTNLTLDLPVAGPLVWGGGTQAGGANPATDSFITGGNSLVFGSLSATAEVNWIDALDFNNTTGGVTRTIVVNDNPAVSTDLLRISGSMTQSGTGATSHQKNGAGTLILENSAVGNSNSFGGSITINGGTLVFNGSPLAPAVNVGRLTMTPSATGTNLVLGSGVTLTRQEQTNFVANAGNFAGGITVSGGGQIAFTTAAVTAQVFRDFIINDNTLVTDDVAISVPLVNGPGTGVVHFTKQGAGQLVLSGNNAYLGATVVYKGALVIDYSASTTQKLSDTADLEPRGGTVIFKGNSSGAVTETVGNLSPGSSNLGLQLAVPNVNPTGSEPNSYGSINNTAAPNGGLSIIQLQPSGSQALTLNIRGFNRNPGGGIVLLSTTGASAKFTTPQAGDASNGGLLATNVLLNGRWIANDGTGQIVRAFGTAQSDPGLWQQTQSVELNQNVTGSQTLAENRVAGLTFGGTATAFAINNPTRSLTLGNSAILVAPESSAATIEISGGKLMTEQPYRSAAGADLLLENFSTGLLKISSNILNNAPQGNVQTITIAGTGPIELAGKSTSILTYNGGTLLRGAVKVIGGATLRVSGGDAISDYQAIDLGTAGDLGGNFVIADGHSETIGGLLGVNTNQGVTTGSISLGTGGSLTINQTLADTFAGPITGTGSFIKQGNATFTSNGSALTFGGTLEVRGGLFDLTGNLTDGLTGNITSVLLRGGEIRGEHNVGGLAAINKLPDNATFTLDGTIGSGLRITSSNASGRTESILGVNVAAGANVITVDAANTTSQFTLNLTKGTNALARTGTGTLLVRGDNLGGGLGGSLNNSARIFLGSGSTGLGLIGGGTTPALPTQYSIVPWMIGTTIDGASATGVGDSFVTYGINGLRPLNTTAEYTTNYATATSLDNFSASSDQASLVTKTVNALRLDTIANPVTLSGSGGSVLTVASGAILVSAGANTNGATLTGFDRVDPGATGELVVSVTSSNAAAANARLTVDSAIRDTGFGATGLTKTGNGTLRLNSTNNNFTGGMTINQGTVEFSDSLARELGSATNVIRLSGGTLKYAGASNTDISTHPIVLSGPSSFYTPTGTGLAGNGLSRGSVIDTSGDIGVGRNMTIAGPSGTGGLVKIGPGILTMSTPATYTGTTTILQGSMSFHSIAGMGGLFLVPENIGGLDNIVEAAVTNSMSVQQLMVGGVFTSASSLSGSATLVVGTPSIHPAVTIGNGGGDSFVIVGYHDEGAANGAGSTITKGTLDLSDAGPVNINVSRFLVGQNKGAGSGRTDGDVDLSISSTNNVTAGTMVIGNSPGPNSAAGGISSVVRLGSAANNFNVDSLIIGGQNSNGGITFAQAASGGTFTLRDRSGQGGANLYIGDNDDNTGSIPLNDSVPVLDTFGGTIDANLNLLVIARHGTGAGGGRGALRFNAGQINAATVLLAQTDTRGDSTTDINTIAEITQDAGTFGFGQMSQGGGSVSYNWNGGAITNYPGVNAVNQNVLITLNTGPDLLPHNVNVASGRTMTFEANAGFNGGSELTKVGPGTLILKGSPENGSNYSGGTVVQEGVLLANNTFGSSATGSALVTVKNGGELGGSGSIVGEVFVEAGGKLSVGGTPGTIGQLSLGNSVFLDPSSVLKIEISSALQTSDQLSLTDGGSLIIDPGFPFDNPDGNSSTTAILDITDVNRAAFPPVGMSLTIIDAAGGWNHELFKLPDGTVITDYDPFDPTASTLFFIDGYGYRLDYDGGGSGTQVQLIAVPEPGALASLIGGLGMLLGLQRFRRWNAKG